MNMRARKLRRGLQWQRRILDKSLIYFMSNRHIMIEDWFVWGREEENPSCVSEPGPGTVQHHCLITLLILMDTNRLLSSLQPEGLVLDVRKLRLRPCGLDVAWVCLPKLHLLEAWSLVWWGWGGGTFNRWGLVGGDQVIESNALGGD